MKKLLRTVIALIVLLVVLVAAGSLAIDSLARAGLESGATYAMGVETSVEELDLGILSGRLAIGGLRFANPEGFSSEHLMRSGQFELEMRPGSVFQETVELNRFELDSLDVNIEQRAAGSNVAKVIDNLKRFGGDGTKGEPKDKEGKKVKVDRISIKNVVAHFHLLPELAPGGPITVEIPEIVLTDVTSDNAGGVAVARLVSRIVPAILAAIIRQAPDTVDADFLQGLDTQVAELTETLGEQAQKLTAQAQAELKERTEKIVDDIFEKILTPQDPPAEGD
ncbi:MAG: DUF748 domain-containing protein [Planctomycetota bacterium]|jgi:hypothetical protein